MSILMNKPSPHFGEPAWDIARLFPVQGQWSEKEYFEVSARTNRLIEFSDGYIEILQTPTTSHQDILLFLYEMLKAFAVTHKLGKVSVAPLPVRLWPSKYREPDVLFMRTEHAERIGEQCWEGADLVMEVVSEDRRHDLEVKRDDYAKGGIPEYWIVDPRDGRITVLGLDGSSFIVLGEYLAGDRATSCMLPGFFINVTEVFAPKP